MLLNEIGLGESSGYSLSGSVTPDLIRSKVWLLQKLEQLRPRVGTVYILGSWYGNLSLYMTLQPRLEHGRIINVDRHAGRLRTGAALLRAAGARDVENMHRDANDLDYRQLGQDGVVINTSLNDIQGDEWFQNIPRGTLVVLQARDHVPNEKFSSVRDVMAQYPLSEILYAGTRRLRDPETGYHRFMVIGIR